MALAGALISGCVLTRGNSIVPTTDAAVSYYESIARTWERAAFIRARPIAGNLELATIFSSFHLSSGGTI